MKKLILLFSLGVLFFFSCKEDDNDPVTPTTGTIQGKVTSATDNSIVEGADISTTPATSSVTTNSSGDYVINSVSSGNYVVTATKSGFNDGSASVSVTSGNTATANIQMNGAAIPTQGLVAYYPFNGNANDESGNGNNGTVHGAVLATDRFGTANKSYSFNRSAIDYISVPHSSSLNLSGAYSFSLWIYQISVSTATGYRIIDKTIAGSCIGWNLDTQDQSTGRRIRMDVSCPWVISNTPHSLNQWHHVVVTVNGSSITFYLDGQQDGSGSVGGTPTNTYDVYIGAGHPAISDYNFDGLIDDIRIYNRVLSATEVQTLYHESGW